MAVLPVNFNEMPGAAPIAHEATKWHWAASGALILAVGLATWTAFFFIVCAL